MYTKNNTFKRGRKSKAEKAMEKEEEEALYREEEEYEGRDYKHTREFMLDDPEAEEDSDDFF